MRVMKNILRIGTLLKKQEEEIQEHYLKLVKEYAQLDEKGDFVPNEGVPHSFVIPEEKRAEFKTKVKEFNELDFEISAEQVYLHDLATANLSPVELGAIEPLIRDLGVVESK